MTPPFSATYVRGIVVMGISGSGKSTAAKALAAAMQSPWADGDDFHPASNVAKMASGQPLDDSDREPWLRAVGDWIRTHATDGALPVVACSSLKESHRNTLRACGVPLGFVHLDIDPGVAFRRVTARPDHFMPPTLVQSQYDTLQPLRPTETGITLNATEPTVDIVREIITSLGLEPVS